MAIHYSQVNQAQMGLAYVYRVSYGIFHWGGGVGDIHPLYETPVYMLHTYLDHSCNKYCDLIGQEEVSISHKNS